MASRIDVSPANSAITAGVTRSPADAIVAPSRTSEAARRMARRQAEEMATKVLSNPVIESFKIERVA